MKNMTNKEIALYLENTPSRYDDASFLSFIKEVGMPLLPPAIHITGTNGKGSSARYLALTLEHSGYEVGLFTSPHYLKVNELATINGVEINDNFISKKIVEYDKYFKKYGLSAFEIMTYISFLYFAAMKTHYIIVEVGMGGLHDATNIITPILSIITNVGKDHIKEIGPTLKDIAIHKAGIIKKEVPLIVGEVLSDAEKVIIAKAKKEKAPLYKTNYDYTIIQKTLTTTKFSYDGTNYLLGSGASYEVKNAILVLNALKILKEAGVHYTEKALQKALLEETFPGRFSVVSLNPLVIVDGAHNPHAFISLLNDLKATKKNLIVIFAAFKDKDYEQELNLLSLSGARIILTTFDHPRAVTKFNSDLPFYKDHVEAIKHAYNNLKGEDLLLIVGSLHFAIAVVKEFRGGLYE